MKKRFWALLLAVMMVVSVLPTAAFAATADEPVPSVSTPDSSPVKITKSVEADPTAANRYTLSMEAYVTGQVVTTNPEPLDIVLVLDVSGSMEDDISIVTEPTYESVGTTLKTLVYANWKYNDTEYYYLNGSVGPYLIIDMEYDESTRYWTYTYDKGDGETGTHQVHLSDFNPPIYYKTTRTLTISKMDALKNAVNAFITATEEKNAEVTNPADMHSISIVKFAGEKNTTPGNDLYYEGKYQYNNTQIVKNLTTVDAGGAAELTAAVNNLRAAGATAADWGMEFAKKALEGSERKQVVIFFTDGEPNHQNGFDIDVANTAIGHAKDLKTRGATIYTIGVFAGANPKEIGSKANKFMHAVSSNYPEASNMESLGNRADDSNYYKTATTDVALTEIFGKIAEDMIPDVTAGSSSVLTDTVSQWFTAPENADAVSVEVWSAGGTGETATWTKDDSASGITVSVENKKISVTGFDYSANAVVKQAGSWTGKKLVISFAIAPNADAEWEAGNHLYPTNDTTNSKAGLYSESGEAFASLDRSPTVPVTAYSVTYDANGGSFAQGVKHEFILLYGADMPKIATDDEPIRGNYSFMGWGVDATTTVTLPEKVIESVTYYAIWQQNPDQYSVTYDWKPDGLELYLEGGTSPIAEPVESNKFVAGAEYTINDVYTNGTVAYTHDGEDNPADRYIFSGWTTSDSDVAISDGKFPMPNHNVTLTGTWYLDNWQDNADGPDQPTGGDGTPDKYQVLVKYKSANPVGGTVNPEYEVITLTNREVLVEKADVTVSGSTATPNPGYSFEKWTDNGGNTVTETIDDETTNVGPVLPAQTIEDAEGGTIYTYTAYWTENVPNLSVEKTVASVGGVEVDYTAASVNIPTAKVGDTIVWNITVTNSGNAAGSATLVDSIEGVKIYSVTDSGDKTEVTGRVSVPANDSLSYVAEYTVTTADKGKTLSNTITLYNDDGSPIGSDTAPDVKVENIDVEKVLTGIYAPNSTTAKTGTTAEVGDTIKWTITVTNNGDEAVTIGTPTDVLTVDGTPVDSSLVTISTSAVDTDSKYTISGKVEEGQDASSIVFTVEYTVRAEDLNKQISNSATVNGVSDTADDTVNVGATPGLSVTKTVNKTSVTVGDKIIYTITVKNTGNVELTNVEVKDTFVDGGKGKLTVKAGNMEIGTLAVGAEAKIELEYTTTSDDRNGLKNTAMATANGVEGKSSSVDVTVKSEPITPVGPSKPQLNYEDHYAYVVGYPDGLVHPERNITRAEVATIFFRMLLDESREYFWAQENDFSDVAETDWFNNAVSTLANAQLINGYPDGSYRPNANITRAEFATIAIRFFLDEDVEIEENNLSDVKGHWAEANINLAYALELINGYPDGTFRPDQKITRAEAMAIVNRVLKRAPEKDHLLKDMIEWPDNLNTAAWYYADVQEATNSHKFHMDKEEEYEIWTELLPVRDWVALEQEWSKANSSKNPGEVVDIKITTPEAGDNGLKLD